MKPASVDVLALEYRRLKIIAECSADALAEHRDRMIKVVEKQGTVPPNAEKSLRIEGVEWQVTVSYGQSVDVDQTAARLVSDVCKKVGLVKLFSSILQRRDDFALTTNAHLVLAEPLPKGSPRNLRRLFNRAIKIKAKAPALRVDPIAVIKEKAAD